MTRSRRLAVVCACALLGAGVFLAARRFVAPRGITADSVRNIAYPGGLGDGVEWRRLSDGAWEDPVTWEERKLMVEEWWHGNTATPWDPIAAHDSMGVDSAVIGSFKGRPAAAVVFWESGGGSGVFMNVGLVLEEKGDPRCVAFAELGDRAQVLDKKFSGDHLVLEVLRAGEDDAMSDPTEHVRLTYAWSGCGENLDLLATEKLPPVTSSSPPSASPP